MKTTKELREMDAPQLMAELMEAADYIAKVRGQFKRFITLKAANDNR